MWNRCSDNLYFGGKKKEANINNQGRLKIYIQGPGQECSVTAHGAEGKSSRPAHGKNVTYYSLTPRLIYTKTEILELIFENKNPNKCESDPHTKG